MKFFEKRRLKKLTEHILHESRHAKRMRGDIASTEHLAALAEAEAQLHKVWEQPNLESIETAIEKVYDQSAIIRPHRSHTDFRENLEIILVALVIAMGFRTYFVQPFKIPTGSMQPTLYGITSSNEIDKRFTDRFPLSIVSMFITGERYREVCAKTAGELSRARSLPDGSYSVNVGNIQYTIPGTMNFRARPGDFIAEGQVIAAARIRFGDHIFVNKVRYHFSKPKRGDVFVFSTDDIPHPDIRKNTYYIKRLVGLPNETLAIDPPHLLVDNEIVDEPYPFRRMVEDSRYDGYQLANLNHRIRPVLATRKDRLQLGPKAYLPFGDNTRNSLDGRYFGTVPQKNIVGPAFAVYWPFSERWGWIQ